MSGAGTARQFWIREPGQGEIVATELAPRQGDQVIVRALYSGVSRGTESLVFRGGVPESQRRIMRAPFQEGEFPGPVKYGYSSVGEVEEGPAGGPGAELVGRKVFCLYPHQDVYAVPWTALSPLPDELPPGRAVLAANMETAVNGVWDAAPSVGDRIVVIGAGVVGLLVAWLCARVPGTRVTVVDPDPSKAPAAGDLGLAFDERPPAGADHDLVIHASGNPAGLATALALAGVEARVVELSWYGDMAVALPLGEEFHSKRLTLRSSQVGRIPPERAPRWSTARRMALALDLLGDSRLDALITGESPFEDLPAVMSRLAGDGTGVLCHRIRYDHP
jgi:threonine dehydrogenase-like Zn-dependent dehydrogenase